MIGKVTRGSDIGGLLRYLYGPGKANEHTNPHLVASWRGDDRPTLDQLEPTPGRGRQRFAHLTDRLKLPLQLLPGVPDKYVWQCSMRLADTDRRLTDAEWAQVAHDVVESTGFAPAGDPGGCRWVAVRHADDHIHIAVVLARQDGQPVNTYRDWPKVHAAARTAEKHFGLTTVQSPNRSTTVTHTRAEAEKAVRRGHAEPSRQWLTRQVRVAAAVSTSQDEFTKHLAAQADIVIAWRESQQTPGQDTGYRVGRRGDVDARGKQIWFSGSKLSPDLSLPKLQARWHEARQPSSRRRRAPNPRKRAAILVQAGRAFDRAARSALNPGTAISAAEIASTLAQIGEGAGGGPLTMAATALADAARQPGGTRPQMDQHVHDLRDVAANLALLGHLLPGEVGHVLLITAHLTRIASLLGQQQAGLGQAQAGSPQARAGRRAASEYRRFTGEVPAYQLEQVNAALGGTLAAQVTSEPAWPALAAQLRAIESQGVDAAGALASAAAARELDTAVDKAATLHFRLVRIYGSPAGAAPPRPLPNQVGRAPRRRG